MIRREHFHMLFVAGVYTETKQGKVHFQRTRAPERLELVQLVHMHSHRIARFLERMGLLERDAESPRPECAHENCGREDFRSCY